MTEELLERDGELDRIGALVEGAASARGRVVLVEGPAGIGKTELLAAGRALALEAGLEACSARGSELERDLTFGMVRQLFERRVRAEPDGLLGGGAHPARPVFLPEADGHARVATSLEALHGLYWLCANLTARRPTVLVLDDAHWADAASVRFVEYVARRVRDLALLVLVARRTSEPAADARVWTRLAAEPGVDRLQLQPLSAPAVGELVRRRLSSAPDEGFVSACHEATGGNPFLVHELLADAGSIPPTQEAAGELLRRAPDTVARSVELRLAGLPPDAVALARAAAVLGGPAGLREAAAVAGLTQPAAAEAADALEAAAILAGGGPLDFVHPLVRAAVYAGQRTADRTAAHRRAAGLLADEGAAPGRIAVHLLATQPAGDGWVVEALREAGREAIAQGDSQAAVSYFRRALAEPPGPQVRADVLRELGSSERQIGDRAALAHLGEALRLSPDVERRTAAARALAPALLANGRVADAQHVLDGTLAAVAEADPEQAVQLEAEVLSAARLSLSAGLWGAERVERWRGRLRGDTPGERLLLANLATQTSLGAWPAVEAARLAELAAGDGRLLAEQTADAMPFYQVAYVLTAADRFDTAERLLQQAAADARARGSLLGTALASLFRSYVALGRGQVAEAEGHATLALELAVQLDAPFFLVPAAVAATIDVLVERGRTGDAEDLLAAQGLEGPLDDSVMLRLLLYSRGGLRIAQRRWEEAADDLLELGRRQAGWQALTPHLNPHDVAGAIALAGLGERAAAVGLAGEGVARARRWGARRALGRALRALALSGEDGGRIDRLREAASALSGSPARLDEARVLVDLGAALRRAGRRAEAAGVLGRALDLAGRGGGTAVAGRASEELHALGLRPRRGALTGVDALTGSERRVVELAAEGLSNREIAQTLFVTVRTVEVHLTHAYQKLEIDSRRELRRALAADPAS